LYQRHSRDPNLRGIAVFSDGTDNGTRYQAADLAEQWQRVPCPIHTFALGKKETTLQQMDLAFIPDSLVTDPTPVAVKNKLTVKARLQVSGYPNPRDQIAPELYFDGVKVAIPDLEKNIVVERVEGDRDHVYDVRVTCDAPPTPREMKVTLRVPPLPGETNIDNNSISTYVTVTKEGIS